jgi:hypothetical protein
MTKNQQNFIAKMKTKIIRLLLLLPLLSGAIPACCAERFAGRFIGQGLTLQSQGEHGNYTGTITLGENAYRFTASEKGGGLAGSFATPDGQFDFQVVIKGSKLTLTSDDTRYKLTRYNPLAKTGTGDGGAKLKGLVKQHGGGFLGRFMTMFAKNKGHLLESASSAAFDTIGSAGQTQFGAPPPQDSSLVSAQPGASPRHIARAPAPSINGNSVSSGLPGIWVKTEQIAVNGSVTCNVTYAAFRADGAMLMTLNPSSASSFCNGQSSGNTQPSGAPQSADTDLHAHWASDNSILTMTYDGGANAQYAYEIRSGPTGSPILRIQGGDGAAPQEWTKSNQH